ncbi:uncharacterized protein LOC121236443 [Juglans microcarpa x Juglans regia]|uniref:uncharacterized protein LOC121236443 n=1 Tax=Juglans microcarpa x Juglans regia TaxID=2249226 RepID=UPI001B7E178B|nr:uncharacterized protein LOC121236443 [Juglans microcarpa x Juglans regia]
MPAIDNSIIEHSLRINSEAKKVRQKRRSFNTEKCTAITEEIDQLLAIGLIQKADYLEWLFNVIRMNKTDEEKTTFITDRGLYCYRNSASFKISYAPINTVKGQDLADFVAEFNGFPAEIMAPPPGQPWTVFVDGSACRVGGGIGVHIVTEAKHEHYYMAMLTFGTTNNEAEYEALILGLSAAKALGTKFGVLNAIISDNGKQFDYEHYWVSCQELRIKVKYSSPGHPQANRQAKSTNKFLLGILKKLGDWKGEWAKELP